MGEITLGNFVALGVGLFFLPSHAPADMAAAAVDALELEAGLLGWILEKHISGKSVEDDIGVRYAQIRVALRKVELSAIEVKRERTLRLNGFLDPDPFVRSLHRIRSDLVVLGRVGAKPFEAKTVDDLRTSLERLARVGPSCLIETRTPNEQRQRRSRSGATR